MALKYDMDQATLLQRMFPADIISPERAYLRAHHIGETEQGNMA